MNPMSHHRKKVFIVVKTYPSPSKTYEETVCTAGITEDNCWIRLYPIHYRDLRSDQKYPKYTWIDVEIEKHLKDHRPESYRPNPQTIKIIERLPTKGDWKRRKALLLPLVSQSLEELEGLRDTHNISLGMFKPLGTPSFYWKAEKSDWDPQQKALVGQRTMLVKPKTPLEKIPYSFHYRFRCDATDCKGHDLTIIDWEICQAYRSWRWRYKNEELLLEKIRERWVDTMFHPSKDPYFIVGTHSVFKTFMILGVFWPPKD